MAAQESPDFVRNSNSHQIEPLNRFQSDLNDSSQPIHALNKRTKSQLIPPVDSLIQPASRQLRNPRPSAEGDPVSYLLKEIMTPILWNVDRLQVLKRDKCRFQVRLMNKDLKILAKDKRDELLQAKTYLGCKDPSTSNFLVIDLNSS